MSASENLCLFCSHFIYDPERQWGMGSEFTGPLIDGENICCRKKHYMNENPETADELRKILLRANGCPDYEIEARR